MFGHRLLSSMPFDQSGDAIGIVFDQIVDAVRHRVGVNVAETDGVHTGRHRRDEVSERRFVAHGDGYRRVVGLFGGGVDAGVGGKGAVDRERRPYAAAELVSCVGNRLIRRAEFPELKEVVEPSILATRQEFFRQAWNLHEMDVPDTGIVVDIVQPSMPGSGASRNIAPRVTEEYWRAKA